MVALGFIRIATGPHYPGTRISVENAVAVVRQWRLAECVRMIEPREEHLHILERLLVDRGVAGQHTMDAHLAALAVEYRGTVYSTDGDFARYSSITWVNPLT